MILSDFHTHSNFSGDSTALPASMLEEAAHLGLQALCLTDHYDLDYPQSDVSFVFDPSSYIEVLSKLGEQYSGRITLLTGIELGLQPHLAAQYHALLQSFPFDFVIGSSHLVDGRDPYYPEFWESAREEDVILGYFQSILDNIAAFDEMDVYGHLDYIVRYAPSKGQSYSYRNYREILDEILISLISHHTGIELNTAGFKYGLSFPNPHMDILKRYRELGGEIITVGSDAHRAEHLAYDFRKVPDILKSCGFDYYTVFKNRQPEFIKL